MTVLTIQETDSINGRTIAKYAISPSPNSNSSKTSRIDLIPPEKITEATSASQSALEQLWTQALLPFLPTGYPASVTPDYTPYQLYDTLQAFASTIAGLLASRAVLLSLNLVGDSELTSTNAATGATLLSIAQESIGRASTIFFAHLFARQIESEVKFYRFFADIVNDIAFVLDCLSPSLPFNVRVPVLCLASACRAICGVAGGSSKAILSAHFAKNGNIGELNAKDGSQETVVSLIGMWVGGLVVSRVQGATATWTWLLSLLALHLWANWQAVKSVRLSVLNGRRARILLQSILEDQCALSPDEIGQKEGIFRNERAMQRTNSLRNCYIGVDMRAMLLRIGGKVTMASGSFTTMPFDIERLFEVFSEEQYILWFDSLTRDVVVALKVGATTETQLKSCYHAQSLASIARNKNADQKGYEVVLQLIRETLNLVNGSWTQIYSQISDAGWHVSSTTLDTGNGTRLHMQTAG